MALLFSLADLNYGAPQTPAGAWNQIHRPFPLGKKSGLLTLTTLLLRMHV